LRWVSVEACYHEGLMEEDLYTVGDETGWGGSGALSTRDECLRLLAENAFATIWI
jgi:hypothetical protein